MDQHTGAGAVVDNPESSGSESGSEGESPTRAGNPQGPVNARVNRVNLGNATANKAIYR